MSAYRHKNFILAVITTLVSIAPVAATVVLNIGIGKESKIWFKLSLTAPVGAKVLISFSVVALTYNLYALLAYVVPARLKKRKHD